MSTIKLSPNASGNGAFTIAAPNSDTNRTLHLPAVDGNILTTGSAGVIIQTKFLNDFEDTTDITTSTTFQDSVLTLSITPSSTTNKILVQWASVLYSNDSDDGIKVRIKRTVGGVDSIIASDGHNLKQYFNGATNKHTLGSDFYLDSPSTTSSVTYTIQYATYNSGSSVQFGNNGNSPKHILLQEVVA